MQQLREGWYGNSNKYAEDHDLYHAPADCGKMWQTCLKFANEKFIPLCSGIKGRIGELIVDEDYEKPAVTLPIDTLVVDLCKNNDGEVEIVNVDEEDE